MNTELEKAVKFKVRPTSTFEIEDMQKEDEGTPLKLYFLTSKEVTKEKEDQKRWKGGSGGFFMLGWVSSLTREALSPRDFLLSLEISQVFHFYLGSPWLYSYL